MIQEKQDSHNFVSTFSQHSAQFLGHLILYHCSLKDFYNHSIKPTDKNKKHHFSLCSYAHEL